MYPEGIDYVWIALDRNGHVAAFVTGGSGPIPFRLLQLKDDLMGGIEEQINALPRRSSAQLLVSLKRPDDFIDIAERGIFAYDWSDVHRTKGSETFAYELIACPSDPVNVGQLPMEMAVLVAKNRLDDVTFESSARLDIHQSVSCVAGR